MLIWAWAELEADFQRYYQLNLNAEVFNRRLTDRRFLTLVAGLPADSAYAGFLRDTKGRVFADVGLQGEI